MTRTADRTSVRCRTASTPRRRGSACSPRRPRPGSSPSTCSPGTTRSCSRCLYAERRAALEELSASGLELTPSDARARRGRAVATKRRGRRRQGLGAPYRPGQRVGMVKVKRVRTIDAVVAGYRPGQGGGHGRLADPRALRRRRHAARGRPLLRAARQGEARRWSASSQPYETGHRGHGDPSRWKNEKELEWIDLRPELVVEVTFDHASGGRIRHGTKILRWREDKAPVDCKLEQMHS